MGRAAKLKGNRILTRLRSMALLKSVLMYLVDNKIAHTFTKRHTDKFRKIVETICPNFEIGQKLPGT